MNSRCATNRWAAVVTCCCAVGLALSGAVEMGRADETPTATQPASTQPADGDADARSTSEAAKTPSHATIQGTVTIEADDALVAPNVSRTVIYLASHPALDPPEIEKDAPPISKRPQIAQKNKAFVPDFMVIPNGTYVEFPNWDRFSHNVFSRSRAAPPFDLDRYPYGRSKSYQFTKTGVVQVFCNIHPHMRATVMVVPNKHFARADASGRFVLAAVPPGEYELVVWHLRCGKERRPIKIEAGQTVTLDLTLTHQARHMLSRRREHDQPHGGVARGLSVERERLNLPVVKETHPAWRRSQDDENATSSEAQADETAQ